MPRVPDIEARKAARSVYGKDVAGYDAGRPDYPGRTFEIIDDRAALDEGSRVLEIGPGTGRLTRHFVDRGASLVGVEPDTALSDVLRAEFPAITVVDATFEDAELAAADFDLVLAATAFHWVDLEVGLPKIGHVLKPGGMVALIWERFGDPETPHPLRDLLATVYPSARGPSGQDQPFELDVGSWTWALTERAGLIDVESEIIRGAIPMDAAQVRAMVSSWALVRRLEPEGRREFLDRVVATVETEHDGSIDQPFLVAVYTAAKP